MAFSATTASAKGIDIDVSGQATLYYETHNGNGDGNAAVGATAANNNGDKGFANTDSSVAAAGIQLNLGSDLGNNFTFGSQITYLGSLGLDKTAVNGQKQSANTTNATTADLALTKIFIAKQIANTTFKAGRQELPKSLSPLAYSEGWNVYKNTFDAIIAINTDLPKTTLVGAYVTGGTGMSLGTTSDIVTQTSAGKVDVTGAAYMITAQTKLIPMTTLTVSYYDLKDVGKNLTPNSRVAAALGSTNVLPTRTSIGADAIWVDAQIALPASIKLGLQGGKVSPDSTLNTKTALGAVAMDDTTAYGAKLSTKISGVSLKAIYTTVDAVATGKVGVSVQNTGTGIKSPLYSQMMYNQNMISLDADTIVLGVGYDAGSIGKFAVNYGMTTMGNTNQSANTGITGDTDYNELDLVYKVKAGGVQYFAIAAIRDIDNGGTMNTTTSLNNRNMTKDTVVRFWARYNF
ncbi:MAG: hypothetical protein Q9M43_03980 [Sulfurimonas sp.]|nr:hypothetical protein [Sulfurimonas sp.]